MAHSTDIAYVASCILFTEEEEKEYQQNLIKNNKNMIEFIYKDFNLDFSKKEDEKLLPRYISFYDDDEDSINEATVATSILFSEKEEEEIIKKNKQFWDEMNGFPVKRKQFLVQDDDSSDNDMSPLKKRRH
jgi:hypothetical protein